MFGLVDGEAVVAAVKAVATEANDAAVDSDVDEVLDTAVRADMAEDTDVFFLALSDYRKQSKPNQHQFQIGIGQSQYSSLRLTSKSRSGPASGSGTTSVLWSKVKSWHGRVKLVTAFDASSLPVKSCRICPA